jgi:hypothetical protein
MKRPIHPTLLALDTLARAAFADDYYKVFSAALAFAPERLARGVFLADTLDIDLPDDHFHDAVEATAAECYADSPAYFRELLKRLSREGKIGDDTYHALEAQFNGIISSIAVPTYYMGLTTGALIATALITGDPAAVITSDGTKKAAQR